jgi:diaminohydroxyphosphoribosylaminopyrimidine deaminase/5-amino-6-(5-phosphoribosylamino)uracil reductase
VAGKGFEKLKAAGMELRSGVLEAEAQQANIGFFSRIIKHRPAITLKLANSLDAKIATKTGESQWITGAASRAYVHYLRATHDALMVGNGTSLADDPSLTVRLSGLEDRRPVRIVLDSKLSTPLDSQLVQSAQDIPVWLCHGSNADHKNWKRSHAELIECASGNNGLHLSDVLAKLAAKGITRVFCEGGGKLAASLIREGYVDRLITITAGIAIGSDGTPNLGKLGVDALTQAPRYELVSHRRLGDDLMSEWLLF